MVRAFSEISISLTLILVIINLDVTTQNPESVPQSGETSNTKTEEAQPESENLDKVTMIVETVYSFTKIKGAELLPASGEVGLHFAVTDALYNRAIEELQWTAYNGEGSKCEDIAPHSLRWSPTGRREVNAVRCKSKPRDFFLRKVNDQSYVIYRERFDA